MRGLREQLSIGVALAVLLPGCASQPKIIAAKPAEELYADAERQIQRKRWDLAAEELRRLVDGHPYHELAPSAELRLGDMYFLDRRYGEAIATFEQFLKMRPSHPEKPYAMYLIGSAHYHERSTYDRDPTQTRKAVEVFDRLLREHAGSPYAEQARARLDESRAELAEHEIYIGAFYQKQEKYEAALKRFQKVWRIYPEQPAAERARLRAGECELRLGRPEAARKTLSQIIHGSRDTELADRASLLLEGAGLAPLPATAALGPESAPAASRAAAQ
jgi:outer membrane protein assembly factor BamD